MEYQHRTIREQSGLLWTWWKGDVLPQLQPLSNFTAVTSTDVTLLACLLESPIEYVVQHLQSEHRPYIAYMNNTPVAVGWSATDEAEFAEGLVHFHIPARNRYFYFFVTVPEWRGRGVYPHFLQAILHIEDVDNDRFWILHELKNTASARGIAKAGFHLVSTVCILSDGCPCFVPFGQEIERAHAGASVFGLPLIENLGRGAS